MKGLDTMKDAPTGVWATMVTPFLENGEIDYAGLEKLVEWYLEHRVAGLFAVCKSSESFELSPEERLSLAEFVVKRANGRVPVIASGNLSPATSDHIGEVQRMAATGVDAVVLLSSMVAAESDDDAIWRENMGRILDGVDPETPLGIYESPSPYPRVVTRENLEWCLKSKRFLFLKDTSCDLVGIKEKLSVCKGSSLKLFNAQTSSLLESLKVGAAGYSSVMANVNPDLYDWLIRNHRTEPERAISLQWFLTIADAAVVSRCYPTSAKYYLTLEGLPISLFTRTATRMPYSDFTAATMTHLRHKNKEYQREYGL